MDNRFESAYPQDSQQPQPGNPPLPRPPEMAAATFRQRPGHAHPPGYPQPPQRVKTVRWLAAGSVVAGVLCVVDIAALGLALVVGPVGIALAVAALIIGRRNMSMATAAAITGLVLSAVTFFLLLAQLLIWILFQGWYFWASGAG